MTSENADAKRPTICLNMIVRNEAHVIVETLASVAPFIDSWVIVDTGSTDDTIAVIESFFARNGIPGTIHKRAWKNFGANRTEALRLCEGVADFAWVLDADDLVLGQPDLRSLSHDSYFFRFGTDFTYWRKQLFRTSLPWRYVGVIHEYPACDAPATEARLEGSCYIESRRLGARSNDPEKYAKDARLLEEALRENPDDARSVFYLAQSYLDSGNVEAALAHYERRAAMGGWDEEVFYSHMQRAACMTRLGAEWPRVLDVLLTAFQFRPSRAESLHQIARHYRMTGQNELGYFFAKRALEIPFPATERLFVNRNPYEWEIADELAVCAYHIGRYQESFDACTKILDSEEIPEGDRERVLSNRDFSIPQLKEKDRRRPAGWPGGGPPPLSNRRRDAGETALHNGVTLTITTCKRLGLFEKTIDSFLNCCTDLDRIGRWICIDDGSSDEDRAAMQERYPFFEFVFKDVAGKGHARSMNRLLDMVDTPYWLHLEDDWQFLIPEAYVGRAVAILEDDPQLGQVLFNRNYGETLGCRSIAGGIVLRTGKDRIRYRLHQHATPGTKEYDDLLASFPSAAPTVAYWPHFSLRPSMLRTDAIRAVGRFDREAAHFEREFAGRYIQQGFQSAFFDAIHAEHIGRLTWEIGGDKPNAYELNGERQFVAPENEHPYADSLRVRVVNLDRRPDRWMSFAQSVRQNAGDSFLRRCDRFAAVDGTTVALTPEVEHLFRGNDFGLRRGVVGCALSHIALWKEAARDARAVLIIEDDARVVPDFPARLANVIEPFVAAHPSFEVLLLGYFSWSGEERAAGNAPSQITPMPWDRYLGGLYAYIVSPAGAQKLLTLIERDGVRNGIDRFLHVHGNELKTFVVEPSLATSRIAVAGDDSDIQHDAEPVGSTRGRRPTRVKLMGNWCTPEELCRDWNRMSQGEFRWNDLEITWEDRDVDFYVIVNRPRSEDRYVPGRTIVLQMEPWCENANQTWGVKTWGEWAEPDEARFFQVRSHKKYLNTAFWQLTSTYEELKSKTTNSGAPEPALSVAEGASPAIFEKTRTLSTICGPKYFDPGHIKRVDFLKFLEAKNDDIVRVDIYARENPLGFRNFHVLGDRDKEEALLPYRYFFAAENNQEHNFVTEKLCEPLLTETLCFYWGAPNASDWIDPQAFIPLDLDDFENAFQTMKAAILNDEWSKRIDVIRREKQKVLDEYQFFPMLERVLRRDHKFGAHPTDAGVTYHKYFPDAVGATIDKACFIHSYTQDHDTSILREMLGTIRDSGLLAKLDRLYIINVGDEITLPEWQDARIHLINYSRNGNLFEQPTLDLLHRFSAVHETARILYIHTKGASHRDLRARMDDWRRFMLYHLVERYEECLDALNTHDAAACNLRWRPNRHFSGNFWWANARYLRTLPPVPTDRRHEAEWWVLCGPGVRACGVGESGVDHYVEGYARKAYAAEQLTGGTARKG